MTHEETIIHVLSKYGINNPGSIVRDEASGGPYYIFVAFSLRSDGQRIPTFNTLNRVKAELRIYNINAEFALTDSLSNDIEAGVRATLQRTLGEYVRNAFLTVTNGAAHIWVKGKRTLDEDAKGRIREKVAVFLGQMGISVASVSSIAGENLPSATAIVRIIRQFSPITQKSLEAKLVDRGFTIPSENWMAKRLDAVRKDGNITRLEGGEYALTTRALVLLGSKRGRRSPDVARILALARGQR